MILVHVVATGIFCLLLLANYALYLRMEKAKKELGEIEQRLFETIAYYDNLVDKLFDGAKAKSKPQIKKRTF